ncbi:integrase [Streptomyces sp. Ru62]|nr:integrase [Streptomyces sp. Ru62]
MRRRPWSSPLGCGGAAKPRLPRLGQSSPTITLGYYAHFVPEAGSRGANGP